MPEKPNNSKDNSTQPFDPENGQYLEDDGSNDIMQFTLLLIDKKKSLHHLSFPSKPQHSLAYKSYYINEMINWRDVLIEEKKMNFLIDEENPKKRYLIFRKLLGYDENNIYLLQKQIIDNASKYRAYLSKGQDEYGLRVKIYMPIYSYDKKRCIIIRTGWIIKEGYKPRFVTAYVEKDWERNMKDEI